MKQNKKITLLGTLIYIVVITSLIALALIGIEFYKVIYGEENIPREILIEQPAQTSNNDQFNVKEIIEGENSDINEDANEVTNNSENSDTNDTKTFRTLRSQHNGEFRGLWIATAYKTDFPNAVYNVDAQKKEIDTILDDAENQGFNAVFFQVRPFCDAFYKSDINTWSKYLSGEAGKDPKWDPLEYVIAAGHKRGLEVHAWLNPFRVTQPYYENDLKDALSKLPDGHIAKNKDLLIYHWTDDTDKDKKGAYLNPEKIEVKEHLIDTVKELASNYSSLDGIHLDDYFYPTYYPLTEGEKPDGTEANNRREIITDIVYAIYDTIKDINENIAFTISPAPVTKNSDMNTKAGLQNYYDLYADVERWVKDGKMDAVIPQIYFDKNHNLVNFTTVSEYWNNLVEGTGVDLIIGHILDPIKKQAVLDEIDEQVTDTRKLSNCIGNSFFGYQNLDLAKDKLDKVYN